MGYGVRIGCPMEQSPFQFSSESRFPMSFKVIGEPPFFRAHLQHPDVCGCLGQHLRRFLIRLKVLPVLGAGIIGNSTVVRQAVRRSIRIAVIMLQKQSGFRLGDHPCPGVILSDVEWNSDFGIRALQDSHHQQFSIHRIIGIIRVHGRSLKALGTHSRQGFKKVQLLRGEFLMKQFQLRLRLRHLLRVRRLLHVQRQLRVRKTCPRRPLYLSDKMERAERGEYEYCDPCTGKNQILGCGSFGHIMETLRAGSGGVRERSWGRVVKAWAGGRGTGSGLDRAEDWRQADRRDVPVPLTPE